MVKNAHWHGKIAHEERSLRLMNLLCSLRRFGRKSGLLNEASSRKVTKNVLHLYTLQERSLLL